MDATAHWALIGSATLLGLGGAVHCAAMCGPACAALAPKSAATTRAVPFHIGRVAGYAAGGALAAGGVQWLGWASASAPILRPFWALLHAAALAYGLWLLLTGRQPSFLAAWGRRPAATAGRLSAAAPGRGPWQAMQTPWTQVAAGTAWVAWPCGLLQSALLVAALADGPAAGALTMTCFAMASSLGLQAGPQLAQIALRWRARSSGQAGPVAGSVSGSGAAVLAMRDNALRLGGAFLLAASAWALGQDLWHRAVALCFG